jgi:hypothetical protein
MDIDCSAVSRYEFFGNGKTQSGSPAISRSGFICAVKSIEQKRQMLRRDADACI